MGVELRQHMDFISKMMGTAASNFMTIKLGDNNFADIMFPLLKIKLLLEIFFESQRFNTISEM